MASDPGRVHSECLDTLGPLQWPAALGPSGSLSQMQAGDSPRGIQSWGLCLWFVSRLPWRNIVCCSLLCLSAFPTVPGT